MPSTWTAGNVAEALRETRLNVYPPVWKRTSAFSRWPRAEATYPELEDLHRDLRGWYDDEGGLYLPENARARYGELQELVAAHLGAAAEPQPTELPAGVYDDVMLTASAFRTALTEDLESRRQRSLWWTLGRARLHREQQRKARARIDGVAAP